MVFNQQYFEWHFKPMAANLKWNLYNERVDFFTNQSVSIDTLFRDLKYVLRDDIIGIHGVIRFRLFKMENGIWFSFN